VNNQKDIIVSDDLKNVATKAFKLCRTGKSGFKKDGTGENGIPAEYLTSGKTLFLEPISRLYLGAGKGYMPTQYVVGANTHYINDYYEDKDGKLVLGNVSADEVKKHGYQMRPGLKSQGYDLRVEYGRSIELGMCFDAGIMNLGKFGDDPVLLRFVMEHEQNEEAPRAAENKDPKRIKLFTFKPLIKERDAAKAKSVENLDENIEALQLVQKIRTKTTAGYSYNEEKLNAILTILDEGVGIGSGEVAQKFEIVIKYAQKDGAAFLGIVKGTFDEYKLKIAVAQELEVLTLSATGAALLQDTKNETIYTFKADSTKDEIIDELSTYFIGSPKGRQEYNEMVRLSDSARIKALSKQ